MSQSQLQQELLSVIHWFNAKGWSPATSSNYSFRNPEPNNQTFTISRSGVDKTYFSLDDFMVVDTHGKPLPAFTHLKPSAETLIHTMLYENPSVQAVLHTHSVANTVFSLRHRQEQTVPIKGFEVLKGLAGIATHETTVHLPNFENAQDMNVLSAEIREILTQYPKTPGFLLVGHGLYAWGSSIAEAKRHVEVFEFLMECLNLLESSKY